MQKGKHQGGQTQGFSHRNYPAYPGNPDTSRQYPREVPAFHAGGTPGGGPGMRGMHHVPPTQPPTPPTSQEIKQPSHLPPQSHPMTPQSGAQILQYTMTGGGRSNNQQAPFYNAQRGPSGVQRMAPHPRAPVIMQNNGPPFVHQQAVPSVYQGSFVPSQTPMYVTPNLNPSYQIQTHPRHQSGFYSQQQIMLPPTSHHLFPGSYQHMFFGPPMQQMSRPGGPAPNSQATAPHPPPTGMALLTGTTSALVSPSPVPETPARKILTIINPKNGRNVLEDLRLDNNAAPKSGDSSANQTPQSNSEQKIDQDVAAEFATRVAIAARSDPSGSPNSPALQQQQQQPQPSSRASNYSENESQASPDMQGMSTPSVSPSKLDISVESIPSESQIVENNMTYDANQQATMMRSQWQRVMTPVELMSVPMRQSLIMQDDIMRGGAPPAQPPREYQTMQTQWIPDANTVPVPVIISKEPSAPMESPVRPGPERATPVVSALAHGPTVEIPPRHQREQFPALGKGHQQPSPVRRKQRSEASQDQQGDVKVRSTESVSSHGPVQGQQPQPQQQPAPKSSGAQQQKPKQSTPTVESKKQSTQPCQESDDNVQSIQTRNTDSKTVTLKVGDGDSVDSKVKTNDGFTSKDDEIGEKRNEKDDVKGDLGKIEAGSTAEAVEDASEKNRQRPEEVQELKPEGQIDVSSRWKPKANGETIAAFPPEVQMLRETTATVTATVTTTATSAAATTIAVATTTTTISTPDPTPSEAKAKANGETAATADDAKQNNHKQKTGNKRQQQQQAQSKMRLEKEAWNAEQPEALANEVTPTPSAPEAKIPPPQAAVNSRQPEEGQFPKEMSTEEDKDKEKEDLIVAAKNEENNKQTASVKTNDSTPVIENVNKVLPRLTYKKEQWSPSNPDGEKKYDRDFIMILKNDPQSTRRPANFPNLDLLKDNTKQRPSDRNVMNTFRDASDNGLYPNFGSKSPAQRNSQSLQKKGSQNSKSKVTKPPVIHMSLHQDVKLHETENAWKPTRINKNNNMTEDEIKTDELYKRVRGVLNKLTPEKFNTLVDQIKSLPIDNHTRLSGVIDLVFEKAVDEPSFSVAYAEMCNIIQYIEVPDGEVGKDGKPTMISFRKLLIARCQTLFEKDPMAEMKRREEKMKEIEQEPDPEKRKYMQLVFEEEERRIRMKSVGNSRFIGELYKLKMLTCNIMHDCIARLLNEGDEESLECLCKLLTTVGRSFEEKALAQSKANKSSDKQNTMDPYQELNNYFKKLADIVKNKGSKKVSSRVRFMIQDLIDLRSNKWTPRRDDANPKKFDELQKDTDRDTMEMNLALNSSYERNKRQDSRNSLDNRKRGGGGGGVMDNSGWMVVTQNRGSSRFAIESSKLKLEQSEIDVGSTFSLGNSKQFAIWGQGLGGGKSDSKKVGLASNNMFDALNDKISQPSSRNSSFKGSSTGDKDRVLSSYKSNYDDDGRSSRSGSQQGQDSRWGSRDSVSSKHDDRRYTNAGKGDTPNKSSSSGNHPAAETKSPEALQESAKLLLEEYLVCFEMEETEMSAKDMLRNCSKQDFALYILRAAMEMNVPAVKNAIGKLMNHFLKKNLIAKRHLLDGLTNVMEAADDLALDMPLIWAYLAEMIVRIFAEDILTFRELADLLRPRHGSPEVSKLLSSFFKLLVQEKNETWVQERWIVGQVALGDMIKDVDNFVKQNKLEFLLKEKDINSLKMDTIKSELYKMIASDRDFDTITAWIDKNVSPERRSKPEFVRTLMTVLLEATVIQVQSSWKFDTGSFSKYEQLIVRYTDHSEELELPCLYAVQAFIHKLLFPQGLAASICEHLWEQELIAADSFILWLETKEPREVEGHAVCARSLRAFSIALSETDPPSDEES